MEFNPDAQDVEVAFNVVKPQEVIWHQEQAGIIPNGCQEETARGQPSYQATGPQDSGQASVRKASELADAKSARTWWNEHGGEASESLYWQLYKSLAAYRMALRREAEDGFRYDWIVRTRFDLVWLRPLPPLRYFSREAVWLGSEFW